LDTTCSSRQAISFHAPTCSKMGLMTTFKCGDT
jgi:hypothetical protein